MPRPAEWCEREVEQLRGSNGRLQKIAEHRLEMLKRQKAEVEWLTKVLSDIHDDGRCPSWLCQHIEIILDCQKSKP